MNLPLESRDLRLSQNDVPLDIKQNLYHLHLAAAPTSASHPHTIRRILWQAQLPLGRHRGAHTTSRNELFFFRIKATCDTRTNWVRMSGPRHGSKIRRANGPRRVRPATQARVVLILLIVQVGAPRASAGQSRSEPDPATSGQSLAGPWRPHILDGFFRRQHDPPFK